MLDLCFERFFELDADADVAGLLDDAFAMFDLLGFEGGFVIAFGAARRSASESLGARVPFALSRANWDPGAMGTGRVAEPKVCDVGFA